MLKVLTQERFTRSLSHKHLGSNMLKYHSCFLFVPSSLQYYLQAGKPQQVFFRMLKYVNFAFFKVVTVWGKR